MKEQIISQADNGSEVREYQPVVLDSIPSRKDEPLGRPLSLLSLLNTVSCPRRTERFLVKTNEEWAHLKALSNLWQSLGRPTSVFWRETMVYPAKILESNS
jgi:hypothetical protein